MAAGLVPENRPAAPRLGDGEWAGNRFTGHERELANEVRGDKSITQSAGV